MNVYMYVFFISSSRSILVLPILWISYLLYFVKNTKLFEACVHETNGSTTKSYSPFLKIQILYFMWSFQIQTRIQIMLFKSVAIRMDKFMNLCMKHKFVHNPLLPTGGGFGD